MRYIKWVLFNRGTYEEKLSSVLISVVDSNRAAAESDVEADIEVGRLEGHLGAVLLKHHLSIEEGTLRSTGIDDLGLNDAD